MQYKKRGTYTDLNSYAISKTGLSINKLNEVKEYTIKNLDLAAMKLLTAKEKHQPVYLYADYDVDGLGVTYIGCRIMEKLGFKRGVNFFPVVPRRFSDGYGINTSAVDLMRDGSLLLTGDNGITAIDAIKRAKCKQMDVVILDHHLAGMVLPAANIIVDPEAFPDTADFNGYCGAGLFYKLYKVIFPNDPDKDVLSAAAISTIADSVPLIKENRLIVKNGLEALNNGYGGAAYEALLQEFSLYGHARAEDLAFSIIPALNAPGRLNDIGSRITASILLSETDEQCKIGIERLKTDNEFRKKITKDMVMDLHADDNCKINFVVAPSGYPGLYGLAAARLAEQTGKPSFVMGDNGHGFYSGSARSDDETNNNVKAMLDTAAEHLHRYGGHPGAAGFSLPIDEFENVKECLSQYNVKPHEAKHVYDLDLDPDNIEDTLKILDKMEPFGKGFEKPLFRMKVHLTDDQIKYMGKPDKIHLQFILPNGKAVFFNAVQRYEDDGKPKNLYLYGYLSWNYWKDTCTPNFNMIDYEIAA